MMAAIPRTTTGSARPGGSRFASAPRVWRRAPRRRHVRPENRVAGRKTAPRNFFRAAPPRARQTLLLILILHRENPSAEWQLVLGCVIDPNNAATLPTFSGKIDAPSLYFAKDYTDIFNAQLQQTRDTFAAAARAVHEMAPLGTETVIRLEKFRQMVTDHAAFDLKTNPELPYNPQAMGRDYAMYNGKIFYPNDFGNYNYGVAAKAFGFSLATAQSGAQLNQFLKSGSFDTQRSQDMIAKGYLHFP
jgi:hypothetical protein